MTHRTRVRALLIAVLLTALSTASQAQAQMRGLELGPWAGVSYYLGDLNTDFKFNRPNLAGGLAARYNFNHRIALRASLNYGKIEAYDSDSDNPFEVNRNLSFQSNIYDGTAQLEFNFLPYIHGSSEHYFTPYGFAGVSVFNYNPTTETDQGDVVELRDLGTEGQIDGEEYLSLSSALTYGIGLKWDLTYELSMDLNIGVRNTRTDYLDDVSSVYADFSDIERSRGRLAAELSDRSLMRTPEGDRIDREGEQRGDDTVNDRYLFIGLGINYYFGDVRCPQVYKRRKKRRR